MRLIDVLSLLSERITKEVTVAWLPRSRTPPVVTVSSALPPPFFSLRLPTQHVRHRIISRLYQMRYHRDYFGC